MEGGRARHACFRFYVFCSRDQGCVIRTSPRVKNRLGGALTCVKVCFIYLYIKKSKTQGLRENVIANSLIALLSIHSYPHTYYIT